MSSKDFNFNLKRGYPRFRLTVIWDTDTGSLRRLFKNLKQAISTRVDSFEIYDNVRDDVFTLAKFLMSMIRSILYFSNYLLMEVNN